MVLDSIGAPRVGCILCDVDCPGRRCIRRIAILPSDKRNDLCLRRALFCCEPHAHVDGRVILDQGMAGDRHGGELELLGADVVSNGFAERRHLLRKVCCDEPLLEI